MNNLSWMIYGIEVVDNLKQLAVGLIVLGGITAFGVGILYLMMRADGDKDAEALGVWVKRGVIVAIVATIIAVVMPSRQTMILIAGSEIGERVAASNAVKDIVDPGVDLLKSWIKKETQKLSKDG